MDIITLALAKKQIGKDTTKAVSDYLDEHLTNPTNPPLDTSLTIANAAADSKATGDKLSELKEELNDTVLSRYETKTPENWHNVNTDTLGYVLRADGSTIETSGRFYTDFIPVSEGDKVYQYYFSGANRLDQYRRNVCCYDSSKNVVAGGTNSSNTAAFIVPSGVSYVRITMDSSGRSNVTVTVNVIPLANTEYFDPYYALKSDFLTDQSAEALEKITDKTLSTADMSNKYGCSLPTIGLRMTVGIPEIWYAVNAATPIYNFLDFVSGGSIRTNDGLSFANSAAAEYGVGYKWANYDNMLNQVQRFDNSDGYGARNTIVADNIANCTVLVLGDSTVAHGYMTQGMLDYFSSKGKTLTLLGTLGTSPNLNEGRAGWKATDYLTNKKYNGIINPFYNPSSDGFDFSYYMTNQGYSAPNFVVIQLGINDLFNTDDSAIQMTWGAIKTIIDSVFAYNSAIKVLLNFPTPPNSNQQKVSQFIPLYRNRIIRYAQYAMEQCRELYGGSLATNKIRPTYCHLILNPAEDINDDVHPTSTGYGKMALEVCNQINCWQQGK